MPLFRDASLQEGPGDPPERKFLSRLQRSVPLEERVAWEMYKGYMDLNAVPVNTAIFLTMNRQLMLQSKSVMYNMDLNAAAGPVNTAIFFSVLGHLILQNKSVMYNMDLNAAAGPVNTAIFFSVLGHLIMQSKSVKWIQAAVMIGSGILYVIYSIIFANFGIPCNPPANPYWTIQMHLSTPTFYLVCLLSIIVALSPQMPRCILWTARLQRDRWIHQCI